jgi:hypothetical protein
MKSSLKRQSSNLNIPTSGSQQSGMKSVKFDEMKPAGKLAEKVYTAEELDQMHSIKGRQQQPTQGKTVTQAPQAKPVRKEELQKSGTEGLSQK